MVSATIKLGIPMKNRAYVAKSSRKEPRGVGAIATPCTSANTNIGTQVIAKRPTMRRTGDQPGTESRYQGTRGRWLNAFRAYSANVCLVVMRFHARVVASSLAHQT